jgi:hypothetical protein
MMYLIQALIAVGFIIAERWYTKSVNHKIKEGIPYNSGYFRYHELTGNKAMLMHKGSLVFLRVFILLTFVSMIILDFMH